MKNLGSIDNDCFKPPALALLSAAELATMVDLLTKRLNRYKRELKIAESNKDKLSPLDTDKTIGKAKLLIRQIERVLINVKAVPAYKEVTEAEKLRDAKFAAVKAVKQESRRAMLDRQVKIAEAKAAHKATVAEAIKAKRYGLPPENIFKDALLKKRLQEL